MLVWNSLQLRNEGSPATSAAPRATDLEVGGNLTFTVLGAVGERVAVTVVAPLRAHAARQAPLDGTILVVDVEIGSRGSAMVVCKDTCTQI